MVLVQTVGERSLAGGVTRIPFTLAIIRSGLDPSKPAKSVQQVGNSLFFWEEFSAYSRRCRLELGTIIGWEGWLAPAGLARKKNSGGKPPFATFHSYDRSCPSRCFSNEWPVPRAGSDGLFRSGLCGLSSGAVQNLNYGMAGRISKGILVAHRWKCAALLRNNLLDELILKSPVSLHVAAAVEHREQNGPMRARISDSNQGTHTVVN